MKKIRPTLIAALSLLTLAGCTAQAESQPAFTGASQACVEPGTWFDPGHRQTLTTPQALARLKDTRVVLLGETHVIADHHRWHLQTVAQLYAQRTDMILGFEAFPRRIQPVLDKWIAGELSEDEFLKQSEWETVWRYDPELYLPLFHFARINRIPMVALNVDRALIGKVSKAGWNAVPEADRLGISDPAPAPGAYVEMLSDVYGQHSNGAPKAPGVNEGLDDPRFANFVDVQVTWDRAMAEATAKALTGNNAQLVAVVGRGHM
ncbi:MAG: ChaN family lipoprotein, partial [Sphingomonadales bacterium]|nr:ChaN family lipoprotein [Sphingomonadales bacterium]